MKDRELVYKTNLWELHCSNNNMDDEAAEAIAKYLDGINSLEKLDIS